MSIIARATVVAAIGIGLVAGPAEAAEITVNNPDQDGRVFVDIAGDVGAGDDKTFREKVGVLADPEKVVVTLASDGGQFLTAFLMGDHIRLTGMTTFVPPGKTCASACAFVWLAGRPRTLGGGARVGFHGVYDARTGQQLGLPNALLGTYLGYLGFSYDAVIWMVSAQPGAMHWLTAESAKKYGIDYEPLSPPRAVPLVHNAPRPEQLPQRADAPRPEQLPPPQKPLLVQVVQDLHLRTRPDPSAPDALGPPNDRMSKGSQVAIAGKCQPWMGSGRGAADADNIWCQVSYGEHRGWANAYFLAASDGRRLACVMYPTARGCE
jgi:hypothetical protein